MPRAPSSRSSADPLHGDGPGEWSGDHPAGSGEAIRSISKPGRGLAAFPDAGAGLPWSASLQRSTGSPPLTDRLLRSWLRCRRRAWL
ncbi:MAG: hypothetical protein ACKO1Q_02665, partial [Vulcanococcus sp.]